MFSMAEAIRLDLETYNCAPKLCHDERIFRLSSMDRQRLEGRCVVIPVRSFLLPFLVSGFTYSNLMLPEFKADWMT